jgi:hypothetical protein
MFIGVAFVLAARAFACAGSTQNHRPALAPAAIAMLLQMRKASPQNLVF